MTPKAPGDSTLKAMGRALLHRNYRLFFFGQGISLIGTWLTRVATSWLVYRLTDSALMLGLVSFAGQIPTFFLAPFGGVLVDRWDRHRMLVVTQALAMVQSALLAFFSLTHTITVAHVLALSAFQGVINAFDTPARQAFVVEMVEDRADLPNAIALNSSMVNAARLLGPSVAGVLIAAVGEGTCFLIDAISYIAVLASLLMMRLQPAAPTAARSRILADLHEGLRYVASFAPIRAILLLLALVSLAGVPYAVLMPIFAARVLGGGPHSLGLLMGASGIGAVAGALLLASRRSVLGLGRMLVIAGALFGAGLVAFSFSRWLPLSILLMVIVGGGMMVQMAASNTLLQTLVDEDKRGRVMSFYTMAFFGMAPFGSLVAGWLGARVGAPMTVRLGGFLTLVGVALFLRKLPALRRVVRPIYVKLGILPEIASGLGQTTNKQ
ncbi:MFS transporter [Polyangium sp. y55x31]|nr:MFS transporter [Polyangium sp. y55x31]MDI1480978.1 MFS transporter [Polyangium sp. y55x31]